MPLLPDDVLALAGDMLGNRLRVARLMHGPGVTTSGSLPMSNVNTGPVLVRNSMPLLFPSSSLLNATALTISRGRNTRNEPCLNPVAPIRGVIAASPIKGRQTVASFIPNQVPHHKGRRRFTSPSQLSDLKHRPQFTRPPQRQASALNVKRHRARIGP